MKSIVNEMSRITIDPWGSFLVKDYEKLIGNYGLEPFTDEMLAKLPDPNYLMRRRIVFAHTDFMRVIDAIRSKKKFYVLSGIMPTLERIHLGTRLVIENIKYFQEQGAETYVLVADLEASATRQVPLEVAEERALNFHIPAYIALGLNAKKTTFYFQSKNEKVKNLAFIFSNKITLNEFRSIYGTNEPSRIISSLLQAGDILFPQLKERMPGVIPVGPDQSPHVLLARDVVNRTKSTFNFVPPSGLYHKFTPSLSGKLKMSKSEPKSCIMVPDDPKEVEKKIMNALTGGRRNLEEQKRLGGEPEKCMVFELFKQHLVEKDEELNKIFEDCKSGRLICGDCKRMAVEKMKKFLEDFNKKFEKAKKIVPKLNFEVE